MKKKKVPNLWGSINTLRPRQNGRHFADDIFKCIFLNENVSFPIKISLKFVPKGQINKIPALVQIMAWRRPGDKPLSEPMMFSLPMHICLIRHQWVYQTWYKIGLNTEIHISFLILWDEPLKFLSTAAIIVCSYVDFHQNEKSIMTTSHAKHDLIHNKKL